METGVIAVPLGNAEDHYRIQAAKVEINNHSRTG